MRSAFILVFVFSRFLLSAQDEIESENWKIYPVKKPEVIAMSMANDTLTAGKIGKVEIIQDFRVTQLVGKHILINDSVGTVKGYRVQSFSASGVNSKAKAEESKAVFIKLYPDVPVRLEFYSPNFKVRGGAFLTRLEALKFHREVQKDFPYSFIVMDDILIEELD